MKTLIRRARIEDCAQISKLWLEMAVLHSRQNKHWKMKKGSEIGYQEHISKSISEGTMEIFVAEADKEIIGYATVFIAKRPRCFVNLEYGIIEDLAVTKLYRRSGIGEKLYQKALRWISGKSIKTAEVRVSFDNPLAMSF